MPMQGEILITNHEGTLLEGSRPNKGSFVSEFQHEVFKPFEIERNVLQGTRRIDAFTIVKDIDQLTPQLYQILCKGSNCKKVELKLYRTRKDVGDMEEYFQYILEDAKIISVENYMPSTKNEELANLGHLEKVKFLASSFTWKYPEKGIEYIERNP